MESIDAMDFFGVEGGEGPVVSRVVVNKSGKAKNPSGQASSSAPVKTSSQAVSSQKSVGASQGKGPARKDVKGKGKAKGEDSKGEDTPRAKAQPIASASAPASTFTNSIPKSAAVGKVPNCPAGKYDRSEADTAKRKTEVTKDKKKTGEKDQTNAGEGSSSKAPGRLAKGKDRRPFPPADEASLKADDYSDDELSLDDYDDIPEPRKGKHAPSSQASGRKPGSRPKAAQVEPPRSRLLSSDHLKHLPSNNSPDPIALGTSTRKPVLKFRNMQESWNSLATVYTVNRSNTPTRVTRHKDVRSSDSKVLVAASSKESIACDSPPRKRQKGPRKGEAKGSPSSDEDGTPRPAAKESDRDHKKPRRPPRLPVDDNGATDFFKDLSNRSKADREKEARIVARSAEIEYIMSSQEAASREVQQEFGDEEFDDELSAEEMEYCLRFAEVDNPCKYCNQPLPKELSDRLHRMKLELIREGALLPPGHSLSWEQYDPFCRQHEAETTVIPLGIRAGFPADIDFKNLRNTIEQPWIRSRLEQLCEDPSSSTFYNATLDAMRKMGHTQWQKSEQILAASFPGYYGDVGLHILMDHFLALRKWKLLAIPGLVKKDPHNFIQTVLVPESAVMLIMADRGWTGDAETEAEKREEAMKIKAESWKYGHAAFPDDSEEGTGRAAEKAWIIKYHQARGLPVPLRKKKKNTTPETGSRPTQAIEVSSDTALSQSDTSELSGSETSDVRLTSGGSEDEATDSEHVRSRSTALSDVVSTPPFAGSSSLAGRDGDDEEGEMDGDTTIKMVSQASTMYEDEFDDEAMAAAAEATEAAVRGRRSKSRSKSRA